MKPAIKYKIYREDGGKLRFVKSGECLAYVPEVENSRKSSFNLEEHVTVQFDDFQVFFELDSFKAFCREYVFGQAVSNKSDNVVKLRVVK